MSFFPSHSSSWPSRRPYSADWTKKIECIENEKPEGRPRDRRGRKVESWQGPQHWKLADRRPENKFLNEILQFVPKQACKPRSFRSSNLGPSERVNCRGTSVADDFFDLAAGYGVDLKGARYHFNAPLKRNLWRGTAQWTCQFTVVSIFSFGK